MKPIAWYDPSNGMVSTDQDCPLFTPLGQVWGLYLKEEAKDEPVAWAMLHDNGHFIDAIHPNEHARVEGEYITPLYTTPPQRTWVGLTDEEKKSFWTADQMTQAEWDELFKAIEAKLKQKNGNA
jgi:hypothetical protein